MISVACKARIFLLVDLWDFFFRFRVGGGGGGGSFSELFFFFFISPETVKLVIGKPTVCIKSLNILSIS